MSVGRPDWELLQRDVDGETLPDERSALHQRLRSEPDLREQHLRLLDVRRRLDQVGLVDPPRGLLQDILRSVRLSPAPGGSRRSGWLAPLVARRPVFVLASSLAAGLVVGIALTSLVTRRPLPAVDEASVAGTALPAARHADLPVVDRARLDGAGLRAEAVAREGKGVIVTELVIEPPRTAEVFVETRGSGLELRGFETPDGLPASGAVLEAGGAYVGEAPPGRYRLVLGLAGPGSGELRIRLQSAQGRVDASLHTGPVPAAVPSEPAK